MGTGSYLNPEEWTHVPTKNADGSFTLEPLKRAPAVGSRGGNGSVEVYDAPRMVPAGWDSFIYGENRGIATKAKLDRAFDLGKETGFSSGAGVKGDWVLLETPSSGNKRLTPMRNDAGYVRFNENGQYDPEGKYYLYGKHDKPKTGVVGWVDDTFGTNFESWLDEDIVAGAGLLADAYTLGLASPIMGGEELTASVAGLGGKLIGGDAEDWNNAMAYKDMVVGAAAGVLGGPLGSGVYGASKKLADAGRGAALGKDVDWGETLLDAGVELGVGIGGFKEVRGIKGVSLGYDYAKSGFSKDFLEAKAWDIAAGSVDNEILRLAIRGAQSEMTDEDLLILAGKDMTGDFLDDLGKKIPGAYGVNERNKNALIPK